MYVVYQKDNGGIKFSKYVNMVRKLAWHYSKRFQMEYEDVEAQGFLIYCISLRDYHKSKASFSTFLYTNLSGRLLDYCKQKKAIEGLDNFDEPFEAYIDLWQARESGVALERLLAYTKCRVSSDAYEVFSWILHRQWENEGCAKPTIAHAKWLFFGVHKWDMGRIQAAWAEIGDFWHSGALAKAFLA